MMKALLPLFLALTVWSITLQAQSTSTTTDSIPTEQPLSDKDQARADRLAEIEEMRARFRRYQRERNATDERQVQEAAEDGYIWSERPATTPTTEDAPVPVEPQAYETTETEALRQEIGRNLQAKGVTPTSPTPAQYDAPSARVPRSNWEANWAHPDTLQRPAPTNTNTAWALDLGQSTSTSRPMVTYRAGDIIPLSLTFQDGQLTATDQAALDYWYQQLRTNPTLQLEVRAHAHVDLATPAADAQTKARATTVQDYLVAKGIDATRIVTRAHGKRSPLSFDRSDAGRQLNERIELIILRQ